MEWHTTFMGGKLRNLWPVLWVVVVAGAAAWVLYAVWRSPQRNDLATYGAFAVALVALVAGRTPGLRELDDLADRLAEAVRKQWEKAAGERRLEPEPIPVRWRMPSKAVAGPVAGAVGSARTARHRLCGAWVTLTDDPPPAKLARHDVIADPIPAQVAWHSTHRL
jgi:hypothetical protein